MVRKEVLNEFNYDTADRGYDPEFQHGAAYGFESAMDVVEKKAEEWFANKGVSVSDLNDFKRHLGLSVNDI